MLTVRTLMSLLYTSPRRKKREGFHDTGAGVALFLHTFGVCPRLFETGGTGLIQTSSFDFFSLAILGLEHQPQLLRMESSASRFN